MSQLIWDGVEAVSFTRDSAEAEGNSYSGKVFHMALMEVQTFSSYA